MQIKNEDGVLGKDFDPDQVWGPGNWVDHEGCPYGKIAGESSCIHSKKFHGRPLKAKSDD